MDIPTETKKMSREITTVATEGKTLGFLDIIVAGGINKDTTVYVPEELPRPGQTIFAENVSTSFGGKGLNAAIAASLMNTTDRIRVRMVGTVGNDSDGDHLCMFLKQKGVDVTGVMCCSTHPTGAAYITVSKSGENSICVNQGSNYTLTSDDTALISLDSTIYPIALANFEVPVEAITHLFERVRGRGGITVLNPSPMRRIPSRLMDHCDIIVVNDEEVNDMIRLEYEAMEQADETFERPKTATEFYQSIPTLVRALGLGALVVTRGAKGADIWRCWEDPKDPDGIHGMSSSSSSSSDDDWVSKRTRLADRISVVSVPGGRPLGGVVKDTTGAGDCFVGSLVTCIAEGLQIEQAVRLASRMAAASVSGAGASVSYLKRSEVIADIPPRATTPDYTPLQRRMYSKIYKKKKRSRVETMLSKAWGPKVLSRGKSAAEAPEDWIGLTGVHTSLQGNVIHLENPTGGEMPTKTQVFEEDDRIWVREVVEELDGSVRIVSSVCVTDAGDVLTNEHYREDTRGNPRVEQKSDLTMFQKVVKTVTETVAGKPKD